MNLEQLHIWVCIVELVKFNLQLITKVWQKTSKKNTIKYSEEAKTIRKHHGDKESDEFNHRYIKMWFAV